MLSSQQNVIASAPVESKTASTSSTAIETKETPALKIQVQNLITLITNSETAYVKNLNHDAQWAADFECRNAISLELDYQKQARLLQVILQVLNQTMENLFAISFAHLVVLKAYKDLKPAYAVQIDNIFKTIATAYPKENQRLKAAALDPFSTKFINQFRNAKFVSEGPLSESSEIAKNVISFERQKLYAEKSRVAYMSVGKYPKWARFFVNEPGIIEHIFHLAGIESSAATHRRNIETKEESASLLFTRK